MNRKSFLTRAITAAFAAPILSVLTRSTAKAATPITAQPSVGKIAPFTLRMGIAGCVGAWPEEIQMSHYQVSGTPEDMIHSAVLSTALVIARMEQDNGTIGKENVALGARIHELVESYGAKGV